MTDNISKSEATKRIAAIDLGTNSFHAVLVDIYPDGSFRTVNKLKEMVSLAEKGLEDRLSREAMDRGMEALKRIKFLCDSHKVENILAFATSAIREAENGGDFIKEVGENVGIRVRAISGKMEAEMIGLAIKHGIVLSEEMVLMADIGGGSVEFIIGNNKEFIYYNSLKLGVARMTATFIDSDPIKEEDIKKLQNHFKKELNEIIKLAKKHNVKTIIGSSGTMENIGQMVASRKSLTAERSLNELEFSANNFNDLYSGFIKLDRKQRENEKGLEEKRIDIINSGMVLVNFLIDKLSIESIKISEGALREGMILNYIKNKKDQLNLDLVAHFKDPRRRSIYELLRKTNWPEAHSRHVTNFSLQFFDEFKEELSLKESDRELLEYASLMHDIGYYISYRKHHKHALYLIKYSDLLGFKEDEINIMANVSRYHRKSTPHKRHKPYKQLNKKLRKRVKKLSAILRVADGLDRSHYQNVQKLEINNKEETIELLITTHSDPELEIWGTLRKGDLLEKLTGKKLKVFQVFDKK
ncbi:exopolyphosphatase / guanosine-5'-triphosphate,3'-diphosphate pyrophosphatase [Salegentibacter holothuriorum]|uniref:Exopolyphosphatase / guanosine-5'-triphosphate,3'-diphosphate pyrophosphatase n=1 Tax=Salegentibacter holothuriorum TaxID=241145 RepID=A0A1T5CNT4_9FLAO|nr:Ppx/GppA phosphatase family protein [Salegentibacter holothuriorum]SKB61001.1 exopolyphosphatase / guanosine-5'-triphosphate,3'-diphosphate pyrophosphatase [Salegentibacter holothuriorum]